MKPSISLLAAILACLGVAQGAEVDKLQQTAEDRVGKEVRRLIQDRNYDEAIQAIDKAAQEKDAVVDYLTYLKGPGADLSPRSTTKP